MTKYLLAKYLRFDKNQPFIALCSLLAFLGVGIGLMVLIVAMAIMNGFDKEFERKLFTMNYPITILSHIKGGIDAALVSSLQNEFKDLSFSPYIQAQAVYRHGNNLEGGVVFGVDYESEAKINSVVADALAKIKNPPSPTLLNASDDAGQAAQSGQTAQTERAPSTPPKTDFSIIIGSGLQNSFAISVGEPLTLIFMQLNPSGLGISPAIKRFGVAGAFHSGLIAYDKAYSYAPAAALARVVGYEEGRFDGIHVYSERPKERIAALNDALPMGLRAIGWWEQNGNFFSALALEKRALFIVLMLIILVASLNIISSLLMTVMNRRSEIALLMALGASRSEVRRAFFAQGLVIGGSGMVAGVVLGLAGVWILGSFDIISLPADVYGSSKLPMELAFWDLALIILGAAIIVGLSSWYPAKKASEVDILTTLRNE